MIEIGVDETRLLVATAEYGAVRPRLERCHRLDADRMGSKAMAEVVSAEAELAVQAGADRVILFGASELAGSYLARGLDRRCREAGLGPLRLLAGSQQAALNFLGAASNAEREQPVAVVNIGDSTMEIAVGSPGSRPAWWCSRPLAPDRLTARAAVQDPPSASQMAVMRDAARRQLATLHPPPPSAALLAGQSATKLARLCGPAPNLESLAKAGLLVEFTHSEILAAQLGMEWGEVRSLPAQLAILQAVMELLRCPLEIGHGGRLEGLILAFGDADEVDGGLDWVRA